VEAESNLAAAQLLFLQERFVIEARDLPFTWASIKQLSKRFQNTLTTTLWRMVESRDPLHPVVGLISHHPRHPEIGASDDGAPVRHFIFSQGFQERFGRTTANVVLAHVSSYVTWSTKGPTGEATISLFDDNGNPHPFLFFELFERSHSSYLCHPDKVDHHFSACQLSLSVKSRPVSRGSGPTPPSHD
jgi:hypothetical protein